MSPLAWGVGAAAVLLLLLDLELNLLGRAPANGLRVLMYHRVGAHASRDSVLPDALDQQLAWLVASGHTFVGLPELLAHRARGAALSPRPVLLTFDDATSDHLDVLLPILRRHGATAALFAVAAFVGTERDHAGERTRFLSAAELRSVAEAGLSIGLHGHFHRDLSQLPPAEVEEEIHRSFTSFEAMGVPIEPVLAYPYGAFPRDRAAQGPFFEALRRAGVRLAFRIGNRVNPLPLRNDFALQRIAIRRTDGAWSFATKVRKGRRRRFA